VGVAAEIGVLNVIKYFLFSKIQVDQRRCKSFRSTCMWGECCKFMLLIAP